MACRESGDSKIVLCLGLFLVASSFCHCTRLTKLKALDKLRGNKTFSQGQAKGSELHHGRLFIGQNPLPGAKLKGTKATKMDVDTDYQADMGWGLPKQPKGQGDGSSRLKPDDAAVGRLLKMEPKVECTGDSMKLQVQDAASNPGSLFFVDRGSRLSPLPLSKLPPSCGYTIRSTQRDLVLVAPYDGCFVALEEDSYVLPLRWWGLPVRMSCPLMRQSSPNPPMVTCYTEGMVVKTDWAVSVAKIKVNLNGDWEPLMKASPRCGFSVVVHPEGVVISVRYAPCLEKRDGMYTLELAGDGETNISCPSLSPAQPNPNLKNPAQSAVPQVPRFPQNPEVPNKKPNQGTKDIYQPQLPYSPLYPNFFYPYPANPDTKPTPTVQPLPPPVTKKNDGLQSQTVPPAKLPMTPEGQVPQPFIPLPFYPWPEKEPPVQPLATQQPNGQEKQPFYPYPFYVKPPSPDGVPPAHRPELKPSTSPPVGKTTKGQGQQHFFPFPFYPHPPKPETPPTQPPPGKLEEHFLPNPFNPPSQPPQKHVEPSAGQPEGQEHKPLYPNPFYPWPPQPPASEAPQVEPPYPLYPENPEKPLPEQPVPPKPPVSKEPQGQIYQPFYPYPFSPPFLPQGPYQMPVPPTQQTPTPAPKGPVQQPLSPLQPEASKPKSPENLSPSKPSPQPEAPQGQVHQPFYPFPIYPQEGQVPHPLNPYYYPQQPQHPQPVMLPPATSMQQPQQHNTPASGHNPPEYMPPAYCNQFCPSGFSNCCPQIAFHQHLHHIVPAGLGNRDAPPVYPGLPFLPSVAYSGFGNGLGSAPLPQKPTQDATASTSAPILLQSHPSGNEKQPYLQPPDGNLAALTGSNPSKPTNPQQPIYPHFVPNSKYPNWPYLPQNEELQNLPQSPSPAHYTVPSKPQAPGNEPVNPVAQYKPHNVQPPKQQNVQLINGVNNTSVSNFLSYIVQYLRQRHTAEQQNKPTAKELQPSNKKSSDSKGPTHPNVESELDRLLVPYYMLQDAQALTYNKSAIPNSSSQPQPFVSGSKKSTKHEPTVNAYSEPKSYVLLQHGPPGREPNSFNESPLPVRDLVHDANILAQNLARHQSGKLQHPQNLKPPQEKPQHPEWLGKGMSNPLPGNANYVPRPGDKLEGLPLLFPAPDGPHFVPLPQDPSFSAAHLKPKFLESFKDFWKPMTPLGSSQRIPPHVPGKAFQQWSSAADHQANGLNQPIQREGGNRKQKLVAF